jgi:hypothetical protein
MLEIGEVSKRWSSPTRSSSDLIYVTSPTDSLLHRHSESRSLRDTHTTSLTPQRLCGSLLFVLGSFVGCKAAHQPDEVLRRTCTFLCSMGEAATTDNALSATCDELTVIAARQACSTLVDRTRQQQQQQQTKRRACEHRPQTNPRSAAGTSRVGTIGVKAEGQERGQLLLTLGRVKGHGDRRWRTRRGYTV